MRNFLLFVFAALFAAGAPQIVCAKGPEILYLKDGDRLVGTALGVDGGFLRWRFPHGGTLSVPLENVDRVEYAPNAADSSPGKKAASHDSLLVPKPPGNLGENVVTDEQRSNESADEIVENAFGFVFKEVETWTRRIELGARFLNGNSNEESLNLGGRFEREQGKRFARFQFSGQYGRANQRAVTNRWTGNSTLDFQRGGNWILFVTTKNEFDEFERLDYRGTYSGGLGYRFYHEKKKRLIFRFGPAFTYEKFHSPSMTRTTPDMLWEAEVRWPIFDRSQFEHKTTINPSVKSLNVFRLTSNTGLLFPLDDRERWKLKFNFRQEYNSQPNKGRLPADYTSSVLLVYTRN